MSSFEGVAEKRKHRFESFKELRESSGALLKNEVVEIPEKEYTAYDRIKDIADNDSFEEFEYAFPEIDPLEFEGYLEKKEALTKKTKINEAYVSGTCTIDGRKVVLGVMDKRFLMGSMGIELGERVSKSAEYAEKKGLPLIIFTASGGARMQEGILSLIQMAKTSEVIGRFKDNGGLYISVLTNPTTGGVSASFAMLGDITLAEPDALIGFAGPRVIEQTIGQKLPEGFQKSQFQMEHGFVDEIVKREDMKSTLSKLLKLHKIKLSGMVG